MVQLMSSDRAVSMMAVAWAAPLVGYLSESGYRKYAPSTATMPSHSFDAEATVAASQSGLSSYQFNRA